MKALIPVLISLVLALVGSYYLNKWIKQKTAPDPTVFAIQESDAIPVVVAKVDIPWGTRINGEMLATKLFREESVPAGHFSNPEDLVGRILKLPIIAGDFVVEKRLAPTTLKSGGIAVALDPGTRAVSVQGNRVLGIAGMINPGTSFVDVLVTIKDPDKKEFITKMVLENILVLAAGARIVENSEGEPSPVDVFTLKVTPEQGERLTLAATKGKLQFALRGFTDSDIILTKGVTIPEMLKSHLAMEKVKPRRRVGRRVRPKKKSLEIITINGTKLNKEKIKF